MDIYYILKGNTGESVELSVGQCENQSWNFQMLVEYLQDLEKVSKNPFLGFVPLKIINISHSQFKIVIETPNLFVRGSLDSVVSLLNIEEFNLVFYEGNKTKIYYVETSINVLELIVEDVENPERQFKLFYDCLSSSVEQMRKHTSQGHSIPLEIINICPLQFKIVIKSSELCFGSSIAALLRNKGFNLIQHSAKFSKELFSNKTNQRREVHFLKDIEPEPVKTEHNKSKSLEPPSLKTRIWQKLKLR